MGLVPEVSWMRRPKVEVELIWEAVWTKMGRVWLELAAAGCWKIRPGQGFGEVLLVGFGFGVLE